MENYLVLTAVGADRPGIVAELTGLIAERGANVEESRMALLGGEFALMMLLSGAAGVLSGVRGALEAARERLALEIVARPTQPARAAVGQVLWQVAIETLDHPGIVHAVTAALRALGGSLVTAETGAYEGGFSGTPLFRMRLEVSLPADVNEARLRRAIADLEEIAGADVRLERADSPAQALAA